MIKRGLVIFIIISWGSIALSFWHSQWLGWALAIVPMVVYSVITGLKDYGRFFDEGKEK